MLEADRAILDDPDRISSQDPGGMFDLLAAWPSQWWTASDPILDAGWPEVPADGFRHVVVSGMGGSAIGGDFLNACFGDALGIPLIVNRSCDCPPFAGPETLFIAVSYSGNTEETLSSLAGALERGAVTAGVTGGGRLEAEFRRTGGQVYLIPGGLPPRQALAPLFLTQMKLLQGVGVVPESSEAIAETGETLGKLARLYAPDVPTDENPAKQMAYALFKRVPVIYGVQGRTDAVAVRWRGQIHENSKNWATAAALPELDHNEIAGWFSLSSITQQVVSLVFLEDREDGERMIRRREMTWDAVAPHVAGAFAVQSSGESRLARLFSLVILGDFVSCYLAVLNEVDPLPVPAIEELKKALNAGSAEA